MLVYSTNWKFPESFSRKCFYPENLWFWQHIPTPFIPVPFYLSPLASPHTTYKEAGLSKPITFSVSCLLLSWGFLPCSDLSGFHEDFVSLPLFQWEETLQDTSAWSVWSIALALHRTCGQHKQDQSHEDPKCRGWTESNLNALLELDPLFQFRPCQNNILFWKIPNAQFLLIKFLKLKFSQSFLGQITNLNQELRTYWTQTEAFHPLNKPALCSPRYTVQENSVPSSS